MLSVGERVAGRFEVQALAGTGGMGAVYRAHDLASGAPVALKVLTASLGHAAQARFVREAKALRMISHPGVVGYVTHGIHAGQAFLAMEWLDGEDLSVRLRRGPLPIAEAVEVVRLAAVAVGEAHRQGIVHRDLKPANLFLADGRIDRVRVLDFGLARLVDATMVLTRTGAMFGTPAYMPPEQARGEREIDARADVYALGCVLFECVVGNPPFVGPTAIAILAKSLLDEPPRLDAVALGVPRLLAIIAESALAKRPELRPPDARDLAERLARIGPGATVPPRPSTSSVPAAVSARERRLVSIVLAQQAPPPVDVDGPTITADVPAQAAVDAPTLAPATLAGVRFERLADGTFVAALGLTHQATDLAARAAHLALELRRTAPPDVRVAIATGRAVAAGPLPVGDAVDRAVELARTAAPSGVRIDPLTAGLLPLRFDVVGDDHGLVLASERDLHEPKRTLLGRETPCVGRERELRMLEAIADACFGEPIARAVVVTAEAGAGKSRLVHELVRRLGCRAAPPQVWTGRGDPVRAGGAFDLVVDALSRELGLRAGEPLPARHQRIAVRVGRHVLPANRERVTTFIGELLGAPTSEESPLLRASRADAQVMGDQIRMAVEDFVAAELDDGPLLLVLEDLHWGDGASVALVDQLLRNLAGRPLFVLALARPEVETIFPSLWADRPVETLRLPPLSRRAASELVRAVLGDDVPEEALGALFERSAGNALHLEELIRARVDGGTSIPGTLLAMVQARLEGLDAELRRVLRAASITGDAAWRGCLARLVGAGRGAAALDRALDQLVAREVLARRPESRFAGEPELAFRHPLLREGAYAMLTDEDRANGHHAAAAWLEAAGETDPRVLAEHFELGGDRARAASLWADAAREALNGSDLDGALRCSSRADACGASGETLGRVRLAQAIAHRWLMAADRAAARASEAMDLLPSGSVDFFDAVAELGESLALLFRAGDCVALLPAVERVAGVDRIARVRACLRIALRLRRVGRVDLGARFVAAAGEASPDEPENVLGWRQMVGCADAFYSGDLSTALVSFDRASRTFARAGALREASDLLNAIGDSLLYLGHYARAEEVYRNAAARARRLGVTTNHCSALYGLATALARNGRAAETAAALAEAEALATASGSRHLAGNRHLRCAEALRITGNHSAAAVEAQAAAVLFEAHKPDMHAIALGVLAAVKVQLGEWQESIRVARLATSTSSNLAPYGDSLARLALAEALEASGEDEAARRELALARDSLLARAACISDPQDRESFLRNVPENARTLELAARWLGTP